MVEPDVMNMGKGQVFRIPDSARGCTVSCLSGVLWLTRENDPEDYIITTDVPHTVDGRGMHVIEAVTDCTVCISPALKEAAHDFV
jgi:hypothetical protein